MFIGPIFTREVVIAPRRPRLFVARATYVAALLMLMCTAWLVLAGTQVVRNVGDLARFGALLFQVLAVVQLVLVVSFSALLAAIAVAQEKDRHTLVLLLLTRLTNSELVLGRLFAGLLNVLALVAASLPVFMATALFGGVSFDQIGQVFLVTLVAAVVSGSIGSTLALWRDSTYQTLALTALFLVAWIALGEAIAHGVFGKAWAGLSADVWAAGLSPWQAIQAATRPILERDQTVPHLGNAVNLFVAFAGLLALVTNGLAIALVRVWNPSREAQPRADETPDRESIWGVQYDLATAGTHERVAGAAQSVAGASSPAAHGPGELLSAPVVPAASLGHAAHTAPGQSRDVWNNPILWREVRTWAYGRKVLIVHLAYLALAAFAAATLVSLAHSPEGITKWSASLTLGPLFILSLLLVNSQAVTSITSERDSRAIDLLLVTDLTAKEFIFGKLGGIFYNVKEMVLVPVILCGYLWYVRALTLENLIYLIGALAVMNFFAAMLGLHAGMNYDNSRSAIGVSLGTLFFLFIGIATCMRVMVAFSGSFHMQLQPFLAFMGGGTLGLYVALSARNPSLAILFASLLCPAATFYAITSFLLDHTLGPFLVVLFTYGFATAAMLVPAIFEFDVATGRTTHEGD